MQQLLDDGDAGTFDFAFIGWPFSFKVVPEHLALLTRVVIPAWLAASLPKTGAVRQVMPALDP